MAMQLRLALAFVCCSLLTGCALSRTSTTGAAARATATASPVGTAQPTFTSTPTVGTATATPEARILPDYVESDCAGFRRPALVLVSYAEPYHLDPHSLALMTPDGGESCTVIPPYVGHDYEMQLFGESVCYWAGSYWSERYGSEVVEALEVVDVTTGSLTFVRPELDPALPVHMQFLVSPGAEAIAWTLWDGASRSAIYVTLADGSEPRRILEHVGDQWYYLALVRWAPGGDSLFFARQFAAESGGLLLPTGHGSYISLYRIDVDTGVETAVIPLGEDCSACVADVSSDGRRVAYFRDTGALCLRELETGEETVIEGTGWLCNARFSPDGSHLVYVEFEGYTGGGDQFAASRTVMVSVPDASDFEVIAQEAWSMWNRAAGWLDGETPILERIDGARSPGGYLWIAGTDPLQDRFPNCGLVGVLRD